MTNWNEYSHFVESIKKPGNQIVETMTPFNASIMHMAIGVSGEAGELLDAIKKAVIYNRPLDLPNIVEEVGDLLFYIQGLCNELDVSIDFCIDENITKLSKRYRLGTYTDAQAQARADKADAD